MKYRNRNGSKLLLLNGRGVDLDLTRPIQHSDIMFYQWKGKGKSILKNFSSELSKTSFSWFCFIIFFFKISSSEDYKPCFRMFHSNLYHSIRHSLCHLFSDNISTWSDDNSLILSISQHNSLHANAKWRIYGGECTGNLQAWYPSTTGARFSLATDQACHVM